MRTTLARSDRNARVWPSSFPVMLRGLPRERISRSPREWNLEMGAQRGQGDTEAAKESEWTRCRSADT